ncbi:MAG: hypothetical protein V2J65_27300 [Desulfobacteraceae bacterium]|jgi:hypothetical protein|nr:hypothetical protein [Desulfobacteraceae bacterium]
MKKAIMMLILTLFLLSAAGTVIGEEMAKEGTIIGKNYLSGTSKVLAMGQERLQMNYEGGGVIVDDTGKGFSHLAAGYVMGTLHAVKGAFEETGFMVITPTDGDKIYATYKGSGILGKPVKGTWTYVGGTGKYTGMGGSGEFTRYPLQEAAEGVWTSMSVVNGNYKLP